MNREVTHLMGMKYAGAPICACTIRKLILGLVSGQPALLAQMRLFAYIALQR